MIRTLGFSAKAAKERTKHRLFLSVLCVRGVKPYLSAGNERKRRIQAVLYAVLDEQHDQRLSAYTDAHALAKASELHSGFCRSEAMLRGIGDQRKAQDICLSTAAKHTLMSKMRMTPKGGSIGARIDSAVSKLVSSSSSSSSSLQSVSASKRRDRQ